MNKSLYFKIILIMSVFITVVMSVVGMILLTSVTQYYTNAFSSEMAESLSRGSRLYRDLSEIADSENQDEKECAGEMKAILQSYTASLGIDSYRNYYILDANGNFLSGSDEALGRTLDKTPNLLSAINRHDGIEKVNGDEYADYAICLGSGENTYIVYIKDTQEEAGQVSWILFRIVIQALLIGLGIAFLLAFFLAKAITAPIQKIILGVRQVANGEFTSRLEVVSDDEIGTLTESFNKMSRRLSAILEEVRGEQQKLQTILACLQDGVIAFSADGKVLHINDAAQEILGCGPSDFSYDRLAESFQLPDSVTQSMQNGRLTLPDMVFGGRVYDVSFGRIRYREEDGAQTGVIVILHDDTSRYELDASRREFVSNVSHELRTPLMSIRGAGETILDHPQMDEKTRQMFLGLAIDECDRMTRIVEDLLVLSRLDNKRTVWHIENLDVNAMLARQCEILQMNAATKKHTMTFTPSADVCRICADKEKIEQVVANIVSNSIKYTPEGGRIAVSTEPTEDGVLIRVTDNGIGIPAADIPRLFERFFRVGKARNSDEGGTGLGLAIANEIVSSHGGEIKVDSVLGQGTTVTVYLPKKTPLGEPEETD